MPSLTVVSISNPAFGRLTLDNGDVIEANLVIGADGANSMIRKSMKTNYSFKDYKQWGVVGTVTLEESETRHDIAFQKFMPTGYNILICLKFGYEISWEN